jgi:16S rRNA processing protein RimM
VTVLEVGRILRAHGLRGEVVVDLVTNRDERMAPGTVLTTDAGPLRIVSARAHKGRWVVAFDGVADRSEAETLRGRVLRAEGIDDPDALWVHELIGAVVVESDGTERGRVVSIEANPAADLLVLDDGHLVPIGFVVATGGGRVVVDPPAGLFD